MAITEGEICVTCFYNPKRNPFFFFFNQRLLLWIGPPANLGWTGARGECHALANTQHLHQKTQIPNGQENKTKRIAVKDNQMSSNRTSEPVLPRGGEGSVSVPTEKIQKVGGI